MKKVLIFWLLMVSVMKPNFFNIGNQRFASEKPPAGQTRAQWYQDSLKNTEKTLRDTIITVLKISPEECQKHKMQAEQDVAQMEHEIKRSASDIRGTWIKNDTTRKVYRANGSLWQWLKHMFQEQYPFEITDQDLERLKKTAKDFGYAGEIVTLNPEYIQEDEFSSLDTPMENATAYNSLITIRPNFFIYPNLDQLFTLRHEISHIENRDIVFEKSIKEYVKSLMNQDFSDWNDQALQNKGLTLDDIDKSGDLLNNVWWNFHEYRADLEALLAMKKNKKFREEIKDLSQHDGYPLDWNYSSAYQKTAKVPYLDDFTEGLRKDATAPSGE